MFAFKLFVLMYDLRFFGRYVEKVRQFFGLKIARLILQINSRKSRAFPTSEVVVILVKIKLIKPLYTGINPDGYDLNILRDMKKMVDISVHQIAPFRFVPCQKRLAKASLKKRTSIARHILPRFRRKL